MFQKLLNWIRKVVGTIFSSDKITDAIMIEPDISDEMAKSIDLWTKMYKDKSPWVDGDKIKPMGLASSIASEMARLTTIEMESIISGSDRADYLNEQYQKVVDKLRVQVEYGLAKGGLIFKPYIDNENIPIDYVQADNFYPVDFDSSGNLIAVVFPEEVIKGDKVYTRLEYHHLLSDNTYYISNTAFERGGEEEGIGKPVSLEIIEEWADLEPELNLTGLNKPLFSYFKIPLANNKDTKSNLGVSVYSRAENLIKEADKQYSSILWEYEATEIAIDASMDMFKINPNGEPEMPEGKERLFRELDTSDESFYKVFNPTIRDGSLFNGLNQLLRKIEFNVGLAYGTLSDVQETSKTATEIRSSKQRSYATIVDIQKALRVSLEHLINSMEYLTTLYNLAPEGELQVSFDFDDSIVVDTKEEQAIMLQEVSAGLITPEKYLMVRYGVSEEEAGEMLPNPNPPQGEFDDLE